MDIVDSKLSLKRPTPRRRSGEIVMRILMIARVILISKSAVELTKGPEALNATINREAVTPESKTALH
jgi:hypothetical protein